MKKYFYAIGVIFLILFSCDLKNDVIVDRSLLEAELDPREKTLKDYQFVYEILRPYNLKIIGGYQDETSAFFEVESNVGDTTIFARLIWSKSFKFNKSVNSYAISDFVKSFQNGEKKYSLSLLSNNDTLHLSYFTDSANIKNPTFIVGEYAFRYSYLKLSAGEQRYYELHYDSLRRVRGNDLPPLPEIEE